MTVQAVAARERSQAAEREGGLAREHHERARDIDPDTGEPRERPGRNVADPRAEHVDGAEMRR